MKIIVITIVILLNQNNLGADISVGLFGGILALLKGLITFLRQLLHQSLNCLGSRLRYGKVSKEAYILRKGDLLLFASLS